MQAPYNDRWERTKRYLLRNFLVNPGFHLSPIPEEERSSPDSGSLPDLVLEPAPDRHDDPPEFYEDLERRMKRYYRQLFLGENENDDDSSDFEVYRSMGSTLMLDIDTRKYNEANAEARENRTYYLDDSIAKKRELSKSFNESDKLRESSKSMNESDTLRESSNSMNKSDEFRQVTKSTNESLEDDEPESEDKYVDKLIDTCATYNDTGHVSVDSKSSSVEDEENPKLIESRSINESNYRNKTDEDPNVYIEVYGNKQGYDKDDNQSGFTKGDRLRKSGDNLNGRLRIEDRLKKNGKNLNERDASKIDETKSDSENTAMCHRISTTVAEIHETRPRRRSTHVFDNGSPVLIPRLLQFSRRVFGSRQSDASFNVSEASEEFIRRLSSHKSDASNKHEDNIEEPETQVQRLLTASELTIASLVSNKTLDTKNIVDYSDTEENNEEDVNKNDDIEDIIQLSYITKASIDSKKTHDTVKLLRYIDAENKNPENGNKRDRSDIEDEFRFDGHQSETQTGNTVGQSEEEDNDITETTSIQNTSINWNKDGIDEDEDCFENAVRRGLFTSKARKRVFISSSDESFEDLDPIAHSSAMSIHDEEVEVMREATVTADTGGNERWSWQGEAGNQDSPALAFEAQTNADKIENESSDSTEINVSFEEETEEAIENQNITNTHNVAKIINEFWSVSPIDVDIEELPKFSRSNKRRTDSEEDPPSKRKKKDIAIQTDSEENDKKWEDIRTEFFVGSPLVYRLCGCQDHVCS